MSQKKLRAHKTKMDNLLANLRGEVGEIIFAWILLRDFRRAAMAAWSHDIQKDMEDPHLAVLNALTDKLSDDIVGRLSELSERKIAAQLEAMRKRTPRGGYRWTASSVKHLLDQLARESVTLERVRSFVVFLQRSNAAP